MHLCRAPIKTAVYIHETTKGWLNKFSCNLILGSFITFCQHIPILAIYMITNMHLSMPKYLGATVTWWNPLPPKHLSLTPLAKVKFWHTCQNCYAMHTIPNLFCHEILQTASVLLNMAELWGKQAAELLAVKRVRTCCKRKWVGMTREKLCAVMHFYRSYQINFEGVERE